MRTDRIDQAGIITLRAAGRLHHTCMGRTYTGTRVLVLVHDIAIVNAATGELLRELTLDCGSPEIVEAFLCRFRLGFGFPDLVVDG